MRSPQVYTFTLMRNICVDAMFRGFQRLAPPCRSRTQKAQHGAKVIRPNRQKAWFLAAKNTGTTFFNTARPSRDLKPNASNCNQILDVLNEILFKIRLLSCTFHNVRPAGLFDRSPRHPKPQPEGYLRHASGLLASAHAARIGRA
jgi:hypothetical protein